jgi:hypothetical protein
MTRWIYDVPNFIPWDFPTPEDEHNETLDYLERRMDSKAYNKNFISDVVGISDNRTQAEKLDAKKRNNRHELGKKKTRSRKYGIR